MRQIELSFAYRNLRRSPGLWLFMAASLALGVALWQAVMLLSASMTELDAPLSDDLYIVVLDEHDPMGEGDEPGLAFEKRMTLTSALAHADIGVLASSPALERASPSVISMLMVDDGVAPRPGRVRLCGPDLFAMFRVPFVRGAPWSTDDERGERPVVVLTSAEARRQFETTDVVGRTTVIAGRSLTIVGVVDLHAGGRAYDLFATIMAPEVAFVPWTLGAHLDALPSWRVLHSSENQTFAELAATRARFITLWVEVSAARRPGFEQELAAHAASLVRPDRPLPEASLMPIAEFRAVAGNLLAGIATWHSIALVILVLCVLSVGRLLLARSLARRTELALVRTLGARRWRVFLQSELEAIFVGIAAGILALPICIGLTALLSLVIPMISVSFHVGPWDALWMLGVAVGLAALVGLVPAWHNIRVAPRALRELA